MLPYERFAAWRHAHELVLAIYRATASFPSAERFGLTTQTRRAAFSIAANIAEGSAKKGPAEFRRYLDTAIGSLSELAYCLRLARDLEYLDVETYSRLESVRQEVGRTTWGLYNAVRARCRPART